MRRLNLIIYVLVIAVFIQNNIWLIEKFSNFLDKHFSVSISIKKSENNLKEDSEENEEKSKENESKEKEFNHKYSISILDTIIASQAELLDTLLVSKILKQQQEILTPPPKA